MKVLILGGYGTFGGRLADLLLAERQLTIFIAGRNMAAAEAFCMAREGTARLVPVLLDRKAPAEVLCQIKPDLVVDASGPFQAYGGEPYAFARQVIEAGADYIDLADGAEFVSGITIVDELAQRSNRFALSGMSSFPALTAAVLRHLAAGEGSVHSVTAGIAPSPFAGVGLNVIRAIASYAGQPVEVLEDGTWQKRSGFFDSRWLAIKVPGEVPLWPIRFALAEVPDLKLLPREWPELETMWIGAGPTPAVLHRLLWLAAGLVKIGVVSSLLPLAPLMNWAVNRIRWGEHRGGMVVDVRMRSGECRSWHLLAEGDGGPLIPSMAAEAIVRKCLAGQRPAAGARPGHRDLELADYAALLARHGIKTGLRHGDTGQPLYHHVMGERFAQLAPPLQLLHAGAKELVMTGKASVSRGASPVTRLACFLFGFPPTGEEIDVTVRIAAVGRRETWVRNFSGRRFQSTQEPGGGHRDGLIVERFGPFAFAMAAVERQGGIELVLRSWSLLGLPLPRWAMPTSRAIEHGSDGRFNFDVAFGLPLFGKIVHYKGWLVAASQTH